MSIQDDIFDLEDSLTGENKEKFKNIVNLLTATEQALEIAQRRAKVVDELVLIIHEDLSKMSTT